MSDYIKNYENCIKDAMSYCVKDCPFKMNIADFIAKIKKGSIKAAFNTYRNSVGFPKIVSELCNQKCNQSCPRNDYGGAVDILNLEKACVYNTSNQVAISYNLPKKNKKIGIVGAGASGICALLRLTEKNYMVEIFERSNAMGGYIRDLINVDIVENDLKNQLHSRYYAIHYNREIKSTEDLKEFGFDVVVIATGDNGNDFGLFKSKETKHTIAFAELDKCTWFGIGGIIGQDLMESMSTGLKVANTIDNYLKTRVLQFSEDKINKVICDGVVTIKEVSHLINPKNVIYTKEEMIMEAYRCEECSCELCREHCDLLDYINKWPTQVRDEVIATTLEGHSELKATPAKRIISLCNHCKLCEEICPENIDMDKLFMAGQQKMHSQGKMPWAFHDFFLRDMNQANNEGKLLRKAFDNKSCSEYDVCGYAFFPGCQLGASDPNLVINAYESLLKIHPDTAIFLQCCGIGAKWAGDEEKHKKLIEEIKNDWSKMGKPIMVMACITCLRHFKEYLPEIPIISLYEILDKSITYLNILDDDCSIFNPCSSRNEPTVRKSITNLVEKFGLNNHPLDENEKYFKCCGFGGHGEIADPNYANYVTEKRVHDSSSDIKYPFITYCINCRDAFKNHGKTSIHILELYKKNNLSKLKDFCDDSKVPTITERWQNRLLLKNHILATFWRENADGENKMQPTKLIIDDRIKEKLNKGKIFEQDVMEVIGFCQETKKCVSDKKTGNRIGYKQIGYMTYWVEYKPLEGKDDIYQVINAYTHRVKIDLEDVWNGIKRTDL